ncbi:MAG: peptidylprolyl isomerase, partial [Betaproteobacteria bacterium]
VMPNMLVSARVIEHEPAKQRPFEEVKAQIERIYTQQKATGMVSKEGAALLEKLRRGEDAGIKWSASQVVTREKREGLHPEAAQAVFRADTSKLPAYAGVATTDGRYVLYRIDKVIESDTVNPDQRKAIAKQLDPILGQETLLARLASLKQRSDVKVEEKKLERGS